jgi:hypothetical protein
MEKSLRIVNLKDNQNDFLFWSSKTVLERLRAVEMLRQQYIIYKGDVESGLQRVCTIVNLKKGE